MNSAYFLLRDRYDSGRARELFQCLTKIATRGKHPSLTTDQAVQNAAYGLATKRYGLLENAGISTNWLMVYTQYAETIGKELKALNEVDLKEAEYLYITEIAGYL